jgi:hypothetical protein
VIGALALVVWGLAERKRGKLVVAA